MAKSADNATSNLKLQDVKDVKVAPMDRVVKMSEKKVAPQMTATLDESLFQICEVCGGALEKLYDEYNLVCAKCATTFEIGNMGEYTVGASDGYNTSSNAYVAFKPVGASGNAFQHAMVKYTSNGDAMRNNHIMTQLVRLNYHNSDCKIPSQILTDAANLFISLKDYDGVRRGMGRRGVLGACIIVQCQKAGVTRTHAQIATMMGVPESKITAGLSNLQGYHNDQVIVIPQNKDPTEGYFDSMFEIFAIDKKYKDWALELSTKAIKHRIKGIESCFTTTRCVGIVYTLSQALGLGITHEQIMKRCNNISRGTYLNVWKAIVNNEAILRKVFVAHKVPLPAAWSKPTVAIGPVKK